MATNESATTPSKSIDRRTLLQSMGAVGAAGLAGCPSGDGGGDGGPGGDRGVENPDGERVPEQTIHYWSSGAGFQDIAPIGENALNELGIQATSEPKQVAANVGEILEDQRTHDITLWNQPNGPGKADPPDLMDGYVIQFAGAGTGNGNWANWPSCEYTSSYVDMLYAPSEEEQTEYLMDALSTLSESGACIPVVSNTTFGAIRDDRVEYDNTGVGINIATNPTFYIELGSSGGGTVRGTLDPTAITTRNFVTSASDGFIWGSHLLNSGLVTFDVDFNLVPELAEDWTTSDDGTSYEFTLRDGATFHNGDSVTAEDVKWTYEFYNETVDASQLRNQAPYAETPVEVVDEQTVRFNLEQPYLTFLRKKLFRWGVLHPPTWQPVRDDPQNGQPAEDMIGCGPFELDVFESQSSLIFSPFDDHPKYSPEHELSLQGFESGNTKTQAFLTGELDIIGSLPSSRISDVEDQVSQATVVETEPFVPVYFMPQCSTPTGKFKEFRRAFAMAINRDQINQITMQGRASTPLHGSIYLDGHPQVDASELPTFTDDPSGDIEGARQLLADAGWQWDTDGNLHYPPDADTGPAWPQGERPDPADFPCLNDDGSYDGPSL